MAVPFGFSVGDFISGIGALMMTIKAFRDTDGSATQYQAIVLQLETLSAGLSSIQSSEHEQRTSEEYRALCEAAASFEDCIRSFVSRIAKYQPLLKPGTEGWKAAIRKIQWVFCTKKDVTEFRNQVTLHASTIGLKIAILQTKETICGREAQDKCQETTNTILESSTDVQSCISRSLYLLEDLSTQQPKHCENIQQLIHQNQLLLKTGKELEDHNNQWFSKIWETQQKLTLHQEEIPPRILLQQPVRLLDACGYILPIHLDLIDSLEAFVAVVKVKFQQQGVSPKGLSKVDRLEFALRTGQRELSLRSKWREVFKPGQIAAMSMKFRHLHLENICPGCQSENESTENGEIECIHCGLQFRRITEISPPNPPNAKPIGGSSINSLAEPNSSAVVEHASSLEELNEFRRVDVLSPVPVYVSRSMSAVHNCPGCHSRIETTLSNEIGCIHCRLLFRLTDDGRASELPGEQRRPKQLECSNTTDELNYSGGVDIENLWYCCRCCWLNNGCDGDLSFCCPQCGHRRCEDCMYGAVPQKSLARTLDTSRLFNR